VATITATDGRAGRGLASATRRAMLPSMSRVALLIWAAASVAGCAGDAPLACVTDVDFTTCQPLYAPTFANVYANTIVRSCASGGRSCHAAAGAQGGLVLEGEARAYLALTGGNAYVTPGDAACSSLVERLYTTNPSLLMPRGARLTAPEACAVGRWVAAGAPGPDSLVDAGTDAAGALP